MNTIEKKFDDWLISNTQLLSVGSITINTPGEGTTYHFGKEFYNEVEFKKIESRRLKAYNFYIDKTAEMRKEDIEYELSESLYPEKLLKTKIEKLNEKIKPFEEAIYSGHKNPEYITGQTSTLILDSEWFYYIDDYHDEDSVWPNILESLKDDELIQAWADFLLKEKLEALIHPPTYGYAFHQAKKKWIKETWKKMRLNQPSDNKTDIEIQKMYKVKYGLSISKSQIQRFTERQ